MIGRILLSESELHLELKDLLGFVKEADKLKTIERQALIHNGGRRENTAEHSWHLAMTVMVLQSFGPKNMDLSKAVKMALLHDLVEIDAGDMFVYGDLSSKAEKELAALERLTSLLPQEIAADFKETWLEFEKGECAEAKFVSAIDRFLPIFSNYLNEGYSWKKHGITLDKIVGKCERPITEGLPQLWELTKDMLEESIASGHLDR